jgi:uncharacterized alpha/beta hydrolase family protein
MPVFSGNTSGTVDGTLFNIGMRLNSFSLVNRSGGNVAVNVYIINGNNQVMIAPVNNIINTGAMYNSGTDNYWLMLPSSFVRLVTNGSIDYYFNMENANDPL